MNGLRRFGRRLGKRYGLVVLGLVGSSCGTDSGISGADDAVGSGQVTDAWRDYCVATFTADVDIPSVFGDTAFTAKVGEQYLLTEFSTVAGAPQVEIAYLTALGLDTYEVPIAAAAGPFPFTTTCAIDAEVQYYAAFTDVTVYDSAELTNVICTLPAGTAVLRDPTANAGAAAVTMGFSGAQVYSIMMNALADLCGGATDGYVSVPETEVLGTTTWLIPIQIVLKPNG